MNNAPLLLQLWEALQLRKTTFGQIMLLSSRCGINGRLVLAKHFQQVRLLNLIQA